MQLSKRQKLFFFFATFLKSASNFKHFDQKMTIIAYVFPKLLTVKDMVRQMFKYRGFRGFFQIQHVKASQTLF